MVGGSRRVKVPGIGTAPRMKWLWGALVFLGGVLACTVFALIGYVLLGFDSSPAPAAPVDILGQKPWRNLNERGHLRVGMPKLIQQADLILADIGELQ
jgi:hypothetical protein